MKQSERLREGWDILTYDANCFKLIQLDCCVNPTKNADWIMIMVFSSLYFLYGFFGFCMLAYALCRSLKAKNIVLLIFSLFFYTWGEPKYVLLLVGMSFFDWIAALGVSRGETPRARKAWLIAACVVDLSLIGIFKYSGMIASLFGEPPAFIANIALPIGISFYTFQLLSYVVDVYRGQAEAQEKYWHVLLYAALFHQCIAGPIVRYKTIAEELFVHRDPFNGRELSDGVCRFCVGLAKKVLLANACGSLADSMLLSDAAIANTAALSSNLLSLEGTSVLGVWMGVVAFSLQIYLDFSAYSDMAIGMGKMLGLHYMENFNYPYLSRSATEFWQRWHISLGSFFRDYVYIPLGGNRRGKLRTILNMLVVWSLTGLWHGANWNFVLWGLYFFVLLAIERLFLKKVLDKLPIISNLYLLLVAIIGWVLFHFTDMNLALAVLKGMWGLNGNPLTDFKSVTMLKNNVYLLAVCVVACTPIVRNIARWLEKKLSDVPVVGNVYCALSRGIMPVILLILATALLVGNTYNPFLYYQF